jgi:hypothetical protein
MSEHKWRVPPYFGVQQGNGWSTGFHLTQNGTELQGRARAYKYWIKSILIAQLPDGAQIEGSADGTLIGDHFDLNVYWSGTSVGVYHGTVNAQGRIDGTTYDRLHTDKKPELWHSEVTLTRVG